MFRKKFWLFLVLVLTACGVAAVLAETVVIWGETGQLTPSDGQQRPSGGSTVFGVAAVAGDDVLAVGAPQASGVVPDAGAVYIYARSTVDPTAWEETQKIVATDGASSDSFGISVALDLDDDTLAIGASGAFSDTERPGAVYIFEQVASGIWGQSARLSVGASGDSFGQAVAIDGNTLVVAAPTAGSGSIYIFERVDTWLPVATFSNYCADGFQATVAVSGDTAAVGCPFDNRVYVFARGADNWGYVTDIAPAGAAPLHFGASLALAGDILTVGAPWADAEAGSVYVFERGTANWGQVAELASPSTTGCYFGDAIALANNGNTLVVGEYARIGNTGTSTGAAYVYERTASAVWEETYSANGPAGTPNNYFGDAVALNADASVLLVGATSFDYAGDGAAAYVYERRDQHRELSLPERVLLPLVSR